MGPKLFAILDFILETVKYNLSCFWLILVELIEVKEHFILSTVTLAMAETCLSQPWNFYFSISNFLSSSVGMTLL
jgi:hypothetical protein